MLISFSFAPFQLDLFSRTPNLDIGLKANFMIGQPCNVFLQQITLNIASRPQLSNPKSHSQPSSATGPWIALLKDGYQRLPSCDSDRNTLPGIHWFLSA